MWILPIALRAKMAAVVLLGIFFIPFATSDLRGLTHVLTCQDEVSTSLYIQNEAEATVLASADSVTLEELDLGLCGGLDAELQLLGASGDRAEVLVAITNDTEHDWQGSVEVHFDNIPVPVAIGSIRTGDTESDVIEIRIRPGTDYEIDGKLRIGL